MFVFKCVLILFGVLLHQSDANNYYILDPCNVLNGERGTCQRVGWCDWTHRHDKNYKYLAPLFCNPLLDQKIVCCPNEIFKEDLRVTDRVCIGHSKAAHDALQSLEPPMCPWSNDKRIIGGVKAQKREFPHMAAIGYKDGSRIKWGCGGTLISDRYVLTAAHCLYTIQWGKAEYVRLGDIKLQSDEDDEHVQQFRVAESFRHPLYTAKYKYNDIALLKLDGQVTFNAYVRPACVSTRTNYDIDEKAVATGWGATDWYDDEGSSDLMKVSLPVKTFMECSNVFQHDVDKLPNNVDQFTQICAGAPGKDTCSGDSGGPLVLMKSKWNCMHELVGITSTGKFCGTSLGLYTQVNGYLDWIESITWPHMSEIEDDTCET